MAIFRGTRGNDRFRGTPGNDTFILSQGGKDTAKGLGGNDKFIFGAAFTKTDHVNGGSGNDVLKLKGNYAAGVTFTATTVVNVEKISLASGHHYKLTTHEATVALGQTLTVDGSLLGSANTLTFNGSLETDGHFSVLGGAGDDLITGGTQSDGFDLSHGGNDSAIGGDGDDSFLLGAALTTADHIDGGDGDDALSLNGAYTLALTGGVLSNVESVVLGAGHNYSFSFGDNLVVANGQSLAFDGSALGASDTLSVNGASETDGALIFVGGAGNDTLTGGGQGDAFDLTHGGTDTASGGAGDDSFTLGAALTAADQINGGSGSGDMVTLDGDYSTVSTKVTFGATTILNVEKIVLAAGNDYDLTSANATVASGQTLTIDASALGSADIISFNGGAESDGGFTFKGGAGDDTITIGSVATLLASTIDGGADVTFFHDSVVLNGDFSAGVTLSAANLTNIETLRFAAGHDYNLTAADGLVPTGNQLDVRGDVGPFVGGIFLASLGVGDSLSFDGSAETHGSFYLHGGQGDDTLIGSSQGDAFDISQGGTDIATGGNGNEVFFAGATGWDAADQLNGGAGFDYIYSETSANVNIAFGANSLIGIEEISVSEHFNLGSFTFVMNDANVASGESMFIHGFLPGAANPLSVNASAETDGHYTITGGGGNDTLIGGALSDTLTGGGGSDALTGGGGADSFVFSAASQSTSTTHDTITDLDASADHIDLSVTVSAFNGTTNGSVSAASFDADLAAVLNPQSVIGVNGACVLHVNGGDLANHDFLVIDGNGSGDYEANSDFVIDITNFTGTITSGLFS